MARIESFRDLEVYQMALKEAKVIFQVTKRFPTEERYSLTSQIRRASRAVCAMLAEAWARRRYEGAFANKVNEALAEAMETQSWLDHALECEYIDEELHRKLDSRWQQIGGKLMRMEQRAETFTRSG